MTLSPSAQSQGKSDYMDAAVCTGCHPAIAQSYGKTGMGRSASVTKPDNVPGVNSSFDHRASERHYQVIEKEGTLHQRRSQAGFRGAEENVFERSMDIVIGSGNHARTYLHRGPEGTLTELPVSWYAESGGYWAMSPGYDRADQEDFRRLVPSECLFCHSAYPGMKSAGADGDTAFARELPKAIDCQRCHGPGGRHARGAGSGQATVQQIRGSIVNPARLNRDRQLEVCMQCHLETTSSPLPNSIRRYDRDLFSYRPGQPLSEYITHFDRAQESQDDRFEIAHAAYRLRKSLCFARSEMTCTTCHNPHEEYRGAQTKERYNAACRNCHVAAHAAQPVTRNCADCHMPKRRAEDAVHVVMTDHYIQRRPAAHPVDLPLAETDPSVLKYRGNVLPYYPAKLTATPVNNLYLAVAQVKDGANLEEGIPRLEQQIKQNQPVDPNFCFELGEAYVKTGKPVPAIPWYEQALRIRPGFRPARKQLIAALFATSQDGRATKMLEDPLHATENDARDWTNLGNAYLRKGDAVQARQALEKSFKLNPDLPETNNLLGLLELQAEQRDIAESHFRQAIALEPELAEAHVNLANLLAGKRAYDEASFHFQKAISFNPQSADAHHRYGLLLELMNSYDQAVAEFHKAIEIDPRLAEAHADLADLLIAQQKYSGAEEQLRMVLKQNPKFFEAHLTLGQLLTRTGRLAEAHVHFSKAAESPDPAVRQAALKELH